MIIGLIGKSGAGKSTLAKMLLKRLNNSRELQFANSLKNFISDITKVPRERLDDQDIKITKVPNYDFTFRELMLKLGQGLRSLISEDIWVNSLITEIKYSDCDNFIISDVRYKNEVSALIKLGAVFIRINRDESNKINHQSECDLDDYEADFTITNNKDLNYLDSTASEILQTIHNE